MALSALPARATTTGFAADPLLPVRDLLLDESAMAVVLGAAIGRTVDACTRARTKYRVGESLRVSYELRIDGETVRAALRCFPSGTDASSATGHEPDLRFPHLNALGWVFPNDRRLGVLGDFWSNAACRGPAVPEGVDWLELVSFAPERAATFRCYADGVTLGYAKLYAGHGHRVTLAKYESLEPALTEAGIAAPRVLATDPDLGLIFISSVAGTVLSASAESQDWRRLGQATAKLHAVSVASELPIFERATLPRLRSVGALIALARPDVGDRVARLLEQLERAAPDAEPDRRRVLHGDLHGKNVLVHDDRIGFIDLDQAACGSVAAELGSAIAALRYDHVGEGSRACEFEREFLAGYASQSEEPSVESLRWHIAAALLGERALRAVNRVRLHGLTRLPSILQLAIDALEEDVR